MQVSLRIGHHVSASCRATQPARMTVCRSLPQLPKRQQESQPQYYPGKEEDDAVSHRSFLMAFDEAISPKLRVPGLQEFAAAIWERRRSIPSSSIDPLDHLFTEFDTDNDGVLKAAEIAEAFKSRKVDISTEQVQALIDEFEEGREHLIKRQEWPDFVYSLAVSDLHAKSSPGRSLDSS